MKRALVFALFAACNGDKPAPIATGPLPEGIVVRVSGSNGATAMDVDLVRRVAQAQKTTPSVAANVLADDALAARAATDRGLDRDPSVAWRLRALRARFAVDRMRDEVKAKGPPTDAEIDELTREHWAELDSPEQRKVIHALVLKPAAVGDALPVAEALLAAVKDANDDTDFEKRAEAVPHGSLQIKVERLPKFVLDGRVAMAGAGGGFDPVFTAAAFSIPNVGDTSRIVETGFGWHVIRLVEITPAHTVPLAQRRVMLGPEINARRGKEKHDEVLLRMRKDVSIDVSTSAEQSMKAVRLQ